MSVDLSKSALPARATISAPFETTAEFYARFEAHKARKLAALTFDNPAAEQLATLQAFGLSYRDRAKSRTRARRAERIFKSARAFAAIAFA